MKLNVTWNYDLNIGQIISNHLFESPFHFIGQNIKGTLWIVSLAIVPH